MRFASQRRCLFLYGVRKRTYRFTFIIEKRTNRILKRKNSEFKVSIKDFEENKVSKLKRDEKYV